MSAQRRDDDPRNDGWRYEPLLRELGRAIDEERWHDVVVVETDTGVLLKGMRVGQGHAGAELTPATRALERAELVQRARSGGARRGQRRGVLGRKIWPWG